MNKLTNTKTEVIIYQSKNGSLELKADKVYETIWLTQLQVAELFNVQKAAISKHITNIFESGELLKKSTVSKMETVQKEGKRDVIRMIDHYNLDLVLSIGYRVNSKEATHFRQWATKTLKDHILQGYTINRHRIKKNYDKFLKAVEDVKSLVAKGVIENESVLELVTLFSDTWLSLDAYDRDKLLVHGTTKKKIALTATKLNAALRELKLTLLARDEATEIFGIERIKNSVDSIVGSVMQSFDGADLYPTIEEKAAHLLYFIIKNHPYVDGNKRSGAYAFIWFLHQAKLLDISRITPPALTALTLLIAESSPNDKEKMIGLICALLKK